MAFNSAFIDKLIFGSPKRKRDLPFGPLCPEGAGFALRRLTIERPDGITLAGWHGKVDRTSGNKVIVYFGGRQEDVFWAPKMASHLSGWNVYAFNYRGFGESTGNPSEHHAKSDALAIFEVVKFRHRNVDPEQLEIVVIGRSLGTATACWVASQVQVDRLVLMSPFSSIASVMKSKRLTAPAARLVRTKFRSIDVAPKISAPTSIIVSEVDATVPHVESNQLHQAISAELRGRVLKIPRTNHATLPRARLTLAALAKILN
jgi:uncharacterized protein